MIPDLTTFAGLRRQDICKKLEADGYEVLRDGNLCSVYHQPGSDIVIRLSLRPDVAELTCKYFKKYEGNSYLPKVYAHAKISDRVHLGVMEKLVSIEEIMKQDDEHPIFGMARAIASFTSGDDIHGDVHQELSKDRELMGAVRALVNCSIESYYQVTDNGDCVFPDGDVDGIMFRQGQNGELQPVFVDYLNCKTPSSKMAAEFDNILARLRAFEFAEYHQGIRRAQRQGPPMP